MAKSIKVKLKDDEQVKTFSNARADEDSNSLEIYDDTNTKIARFDRESVARWWTEE